MDDHGKNDHGRDLLDKGFQVALLVHVIDGGEHGLKNHNELLHGLVDLVEGRAVGEVLEEGLARGDEAEPGVEHATGDEVVAVLEGLGVALAAGAAKLLGGVLHEDAEHAGDELHHALHPQQRHRARLRALPALLLDQLGQLGQLGVAVLRLQHVEQGLRAALLRGRPQFLREVSS